jgi:hypothetical protein
VFCFVSFAVLQLQRSYSLTRYLKVSDQFQNGPTEEKKITCKQRVQIQYEEQKEREEIQEEVRSTRK